MRPARPFQYRSGILTCEDVALPDLAEAVGTPCYVYSSLAVLENFRALESAFAPLEARICYAVKANANLGLLRLLADAGSGFDIVSGGELYRLNRLNVDPRRIIFSGVGKSALELDLAVSQGIFALVVESLEELTLLAEIAGDRPVDVSLRVNPDVDAGTHPYISTGLRRQKFGIEPEQLGEVLDCLRQRPRLRLIGIGAHIGSQILEVGPYVEAFRCVRELADQLRADQPHLVWLDLGGGFGIPYQGEAPFDLEELTGRLAQYRGDYRLIVEPGRYIVGPAGVLLTRVIRHKNNHGKHFVIVDGAMNDLLRPALYGSWHEVLPVRQAPPGILADVVGPVCESADFLARERELPRVPAGECLAVMDAGAYGFAASSNYNARPRAAEVLVEGARFRVIRRRETWADLVAGESE
jgi:diaminopimelate decarboxylase